MGFKLLWLGLVMTMAADHAFAEGGSSAQPVLVELFTSEGCSSCPPADELLAKLDREQPVAGAQAIVLSEHVDYWNHLGWADPFSSAAFSVRQQAYARRFGIGGPYTPQMVVDGEVEFVGSNSAQAGTAIRAASGTPKLEVRIAGAGDYANIEVGPLPAGERHKAQVFVAHAADSADSAVARGENQGRTLHHVAIARDIRPLGSVDQREGLRKRVPLAGAARLIVFVQDPASGRILGVSLYKPLPRSVTSSK